MRQTQEQRMLLLPQMLQAIEILQLSTQDLLVMIDRELSENETLEVVEEPREAEAETQGEAEAEAQAEAEAESDDWEERRPQGDDEDSDFFVQCPAQQLSLYEHLIEQLALLEVSEKVREAVTFLIGSLDHNGHLPLDEDEITEIVGERRWAVEALEILRGMDPRGIGQAGPKESMLSQLDPLDPDTPYLTSLIDNHLEDLAKNRLPKVARALDLTTAELKMLLPQLKELDPCPGKAFSAEEVEVLRPDIVVRREEGEWQVYVDETRVPPLRIRPDYEAMARDRSISKQVRRYLKGKLGSARDLMASIQQRIETLGRVARAVVERQQEFLNRGFPGLKPLKMQEIADAIGVHLSTVSRATAHKHIQTDFGIFPLRAMFDGGKAVGGAPDGAGGEARASIKDKLRKMIEAEDPSNPHSDQDLVELLAGQGLSIARRTVAKYRKELGIQSTWRRKAH